MTDFQFGQVFSGIPESAFHVADILTNVFNVSFETGYARFQHAVISAPAAGRLQGWTRWLGVRDLIRFVAHARFSHGPRILVRAFYEKRAPYSPATSRAAGAARFTGRSLRRDRYSRNPVTMNSGIIAAASANSSRPGRPSTTP